MAAPHVAGAAALYLETHPTISPAQVAAALVANATLARSATLAQGRPTCCCARPMTAGPPWARARPTAPCSRWWSARTAACMPAGHSPSSGAVAADHVARWDGVAWSALGGGVDTAVKALALDGIGNLYAAGEASANERAPVYRWDGVAWSALGHGLAWDEEPSILALAAQGEALYARRRLRRCRRPTRQLYHPMERRLVVRPARGSRWRSPRLAPDGGRRPIRRRRFSWASKGAVQANGVARWDGTGWSALSSGVGGAVYALATIRRQPLCWGQLSCRRRPACRKHCSMGRRGLVRPGRWPQWPDLCLGSGPPRRPLRRRGFHAFRDRRRRSPRDMGWRNLVSLGATA